MQTKMSVIVKFVKIFKCVVAIILVIATVVTIYTICKHNKLRALVTSLGLQQVREVKAEDIKNENHKCECTAQFYIIFAFSIVIICLIIFAILQVRRVKICRGQLLSNVVNAFHIRCTVLCSIKIMQDSR